MTAKGVHIYFIDRNTDQPDYYQEVMASEFLDQHVGKKVSVWWGSSSSNERNSFSTSLSVNGCLEKNADRNQYRILVSEGTYAYFSSNDVQSCSKYGGDKKFKDGAEAVIKLKSK